ncbi:MAG: hypothetical protein U1A77_24550 [Pirellulales bacterium]
MRPTRPRGLRRLIIESLENRLALSGFAIRDDVDARRPAILPGEMRFLEARPAEFGFANNRTADFGQIEWERSEFGFGYPMTGKGEPDLAGNGFGGDSLYSRESFGSFAPGRGFSEPGISEPGISERGISERGMPRVGDSVAACCEPQLEWSPARFTQQEFAFSGPQGSAFKDPAFRELSDRDLSVRGFASPGSSATSFGVVVVSAVQWDTIRLDVYRPVASESFTELNSSFRSNIDAPAIPMNSASGGPGGRGRVEFAEGEFSSTPSSPPSFNSSGLSSLGSGEPVRDATQGSIGSRGFSFATTAFGWWLSTNDVGQAGEQLEADSRAVDSSLFEGSGWTDSGSISEWMSVEQSASVDAILASWDENSDSSTRPDSLIDIRELLDGEWNDSAGDQSRSGRGASDHRGSSAANATADSTSRVSDFWARRGLSRFASRVNASASRYGSSEDSERGETAESSDAGEEANGGMIELANGRQTASNGGALVGGRSLVPLIRIESRDVRRQAFDLGTDKQLSVGALPGGSPSVGELGTSTENSSSLKTSTILPASGGAESASSVNVGDVDGGWGESWTLLLGVATGAVVISGMSNHRWDALCGAAQRLSRSTRSRIQPWLAKIGF